MCSFLTRLRKRQSSQTSSSKWTTVDPDQYWKEVGFSRDEIPVVVQRTAKPASRTRFKAGMYVWHQKYGEGVVVTSQLSGGLEQVDVLFPGSVGQKTIIADFLKPMEDK